MHNNALQNVEYRTILYNGTHFNSFYLDNTNNGNAIWWFGGNSQLKRTTAKLLQLQLIVPAVVK